MPRETQKSRLRNFFITNANRWISVREIFALQILQYNARIFDIKRGDKDHKPMTIVNKAVLLQGVTQSCYKYVTELQGEFHLTK